jgi:cobalt-zinc-cadmium efflux system outer membrane protein
MTVRLWSTATLAAVFAVTVGGCGRPFVHPDPRDFQITNLPPANPDAASSPAVAAAPAPARNAIPAEPTPVGDRQPKATGAVFEIPPELPGAGTPPIEMPKLAGLTAAERAKAIKDRFPAFPPLSPEPKPAASPTGQPLTLADLEQLALQNSPVVKQAAADVQAARGTMIQAGLMPNPEAGFQSDQINSGTGISTRGQNGGYVGWLLKTAGKLRLARLVESMNYLNAEVALRRAQIDVTTQVRQGYFAVLVAQQGIVLNRALAEFSGDIYQAQLALVQSGEQAGYEPLQSYVLAVQARGTLVQARNRYLSAWRQLAAVLNQPLMPPTEVAGRADAPAPLFNFDELKDLMMANHTDLATAQNTILRERYQLQLAKVTPIPDLRYQMYIEKDWSQPPFNTQVGIQAGGQLPVFDRNQGNRLNAQANLARALQEPQRVTNDLSGRLAEAWERYSNNKVLVEYYRNQAIPNQVRVYRGTFQRFRQDAARINYNDVVIAQQTLATVLTSYLAFLTAQWTAAVDLANLSQQPELYPGGVLPPPDVPIERLLVPEGPPDPPPGPVLPDPRPLPPDAKKE